MNRIVGAKEIQEEINRLSVGQTTAQRAQKRWVAVQVQVNCEKRTATRLSKSGFETFIPTQKEVHQWSDRKKKIDRRIIPMVVFVRATMDEEIWLRNQSFVCKLIALPGTAEDRKRLASPIPDEQIERLQFLLGKAETAVTIVTNLKVGDPVRVTQGPLRGLEGVVCDVEEKSTVVGIRIDGLGYACVKIAKNYLTC